MSRGFADLIAYYLGWHEAEGHTEGTRRAYRVNLLDWRRFIERRDAGAKVGDVSAHHVLAYLKDMLERGLAPQTRKTRFRALAAFFNWCVDLGYIKRSPAGRLRAPKVPKKSKPFGSEAGWRRLMELCPPKFFLQARHREMLVPVTTTGIRHLALTELTVGDLGWD